MFELGIFALAFRCGGVVSYSWLEGATFGDFPGDVLTSDGEGIVDERIRKKNA